MLALTLKLILKRVFECSISLKWSSIDAGSVELYLVTFDQELSNFEILGSQSRGLTHAVSEC